MPRPRKRLRAKGAPRREDLYDPTGANPIEGSLQNPRFCGAKKLHDKRDDMAKRDAHREMDRAMKERNR